MFNLAVKTNEQVTTPQFKLKTLVQYTAQAANDSVYGLKLLRPQIELLKQTKKFVLFVAGFGAGKSHSLHTAAVLDVLQYPGIKVLVLAPSYDLLYLNNIPGIEEILTNLGIGYELHKTKNIITITATGSQIILRSMDNPGRIVGFEVCRTYIDEADILPLDHMEQVWIKALGRTRQNVWFKGQLVPTRVWAFSTPEGYKFCYKRWIKEGGKDYAMVRARTYDNPFLSPDFIAGLRATYPAQLIEAYLEGKFVNLTSGAIYYAFDRTVHDSNEEVEDDEKLYIGMDFNVEKQCSIVYVKRQNAFHAVDELINLVDTPATIDEIRLRYPKNPIICYPDASGRNRHSTSASTSDIALLRKAGFTVRAKSKNPFVKDRIAAVNNAFEKHMLYVNTTKCPVFTECLEQQTYDKIGKPDKKSGKDHPNDAGGYPIAYEMPVLDRRAHMKLISL